MLEGLLPNDADRFLLHWSTKAAWELYWCLLCAGIEHYQKVSRLHPIVRYDPLDKYLSENADLVKHIIDLRDGFLHPLKQVDHEARLAHFFVEAKILAAGTYSATENVQTLVDEYLVGFRRKLLGELSGALAEEDPIVALTYFHRMEELEHRLTGTEGVGYHQDVQTGVRLAGGTDAYSEWEQLQRVKKLERARWLCLLPLPEPPYHKSLASVQTPMNGPTLDLMSMAVSLEKDGLSAPAEYLPTHIWKGTYNPVTPNLAVRHATEFASPHICLRPKGLSFRVVEIFERTAPSVMGL